MSESGSTDFVEDLVRLEAEAAADDLLHDLGGAAEDRNDLLGSGRTYRFPLVIASRALCLPFWRVPSPVRSSLLRVTPRPSWPCLPVAVTASCVRNVNQPELPVTCVLAQGGESREVPVDARGRVVLIE